MILTVTGHRPPTLGGYGESIRLKLVEFAKQQIFIIEPDKVVTGMAQGWDQACAEAALYFKVPFIAVTSFYGQERLWSEPSQRRFLDLWHKADKVIVTQNAPSKQAYIERDEKMVDMGHEVLALWNGKKNGGTWKTVRYAVQQGKEVTNVWEGWLDFKEG